MTHKVYLAEDDSYFLSEIIKQQFQEISKNKIKDLSVLEVGIGSGIQLETLHSCGIKKQNIFGVDINKKAVKLCKSKGFRCIESDLFQNIPKQKFDIIIFNPPYLPESKYDSQPDTSGGKKGNETINEFLNQAKKFMKNSSFILLLTSSLTPKINTKRYKKKIIAQTKLFYEELYIWKLILE
jgi:HemK-related putative methylase